MRRIICRVASMGYSVCSLPALVLPAAAVGLVLAAPGFAGAVEVQAVQLVFGEQAVDARYQPVGPTAPGTGGVEGLELGPVAVLSRE